MRTRGKGAIASHSVVRMLKLVTGIGLSTIFLYATFASLPMSQVASYLGEASPGWILSTFGFILIAYVLKTYRWTLMLRSLGARIGIRQTAAPFVGSVAFNNILPFRAGDVLRVLAGKRFTGIPATGQAGSLILERLLDLLVLMLFLFVTLATQSIDFIDERLVAGLRVAALAVALGVLLFVALPVPIRMVVSRTHERFPKARPVSAILLRLSGAISILSRPGFLVRMVIVSCLAWVAEAGAYFAVAKALNLSIGPEAALLAMSIGTLSTIIPSSPGYVGTFHYFTARAMVASGVGEAAAAAFAILIHGLLWVFTTATGFLLLAISAPELREARRRAIARQTEGK